MKCGKYGHKAADCRSKAEDDEKETQNNQDCGKRKFNGTCFNCGKKGHMKKDCWSKKKSDKAANKIKEEKDSDSEEELTLNVKEIEENEIEENSKIFLIKLKNPRRILS